MTKPEPANRELTPAQNYVRIILWSVLLCVPLFALGAMMAAVEHISEDGGGWVDYALVAGGILVIAVSVYFLWRWLPDFTMGEPNTPRGNRMRWVLVAIAVISALITIPLLSGGDPADGPHPLFSNAPVAPTIALVTALAWGLLMPPLILFSRRNADEHKLQTQDFGMMVGFQAFSLAAPVWWMGWRGGFLPAPDVMILFAATLAISLIVTIWKQFV